MESEKVCTLSIDHAIRIAKIIATAPVERIVGALWRLSGQAIKHLLTDPNQQGGSEEP